MCKQSAVLISVGVLCVLFPTAWGEHQYDGESTSRQGKIFGRNFWEGLGKGLEDTANMFSRVSDNLEVALDQMTENFDDQMEGFADKINKRVDNVMFPFLRRPQYQPNFDDYPVSAVAGDLGSSGIDDGLEVYYPDGGKMEHQHPEGTEVQISKLPTPDSENQRPPSMLIPGENNEKNPFQFSLTSSLFGRPFGGFSPFGSHNGGIFNLFRNRPWWHGQNVCIDREEIDEDESNIKGQDEVDTAEVESEAREANATEKQPDVNISVPDGPQIFSFGFNSMEMSSCNDQGEKYTCVTSTRRRGIHKTIKITYRCCHGFVRDGNDCSKILLRNLPETLENLDSTKDFLSLVKAAGLVNDLSRANATIFAPTNEAIEEYTADLEENNELENNLDGDRKQVNKISRRRRDTQRLSPILLGHIVEGFVYAGDITDEEVMLSLNPQSSLRFNIYNTYPTTVTVNCARMIKGNQHAINGVVHTIDKVLTPVDKSIADVIGSDPQFSVLKKLLSRSELLEELRNDGQFTLLAPTDSAFETLDPLKLESLLNGDSCLDAALKNHVLTNTICSAAIQGKRRTQNLLEDYLIVERTDNDKLFIGGAKILVKDIVASNGVVHIIDKVLMPNEAKTVGEILETHNLTGFIELVELAGLMDELNSQKDITVFAPSNKAIEGVPEKDMDALKEDKEKLKNLLRYHVTSSPIKARNINNNQMADTSAGHPIRINLYSTVPLLSDIFGRKSAPSRVTAGCSVVSLMDSRACGAVVHVVERMLEIPRSNVLEMLSSVPHFSLFNQMVKDTGMDQELAGEGPYTVLVPSDHALKTLPEDELADLMKNDDLKEKIVKKHIMQEHICCSGINPNGIIFMDRKRALDGSTIHIRRSPAGKLMAGSARIVDCGAPTDNGIVHTVNRVLLSDREFGEYGNERIGSPGVKIFPLNRIGALFGL